MTFQFRLRAVLTVRERLRDEVRVRLAEAEAAVREAQAVVERLATELQESQARHQSEVRLSDPSALLHASEFRRGVRVRTSQAVEAVREAERRREIVLNDLAEADRGVRLLERLREKQFAEYRAAEQRREQQMLEDGWSAMQQSAAVEQSHPAPDTTQADR